MNYKTATLALVSTLASLTIKAQDASNILVSDTRGENLPPAAYSQQVKFDFKYRSALAVPGTGNFSGLMTFAPWADFSGDKVHQLNFNNGGIYYRMGAQGSNWENWQRILSENSAGRAGIGTDDPADRLHVAAANNEGILIGNYNDQLGWHGDGAPAAYHIRFAGYRDMISNYSGARISAVRTNRCCNALATGMELAFFTSAMATASGDGSLNEVMRLTDVGNVGIGTTTPSEKLSVNGNIRTRKLLVTQQNWPDFVFDTAYPLPSLQTVAGYIRSNKHLPGVPAAAEVEQKGLDVGSMQSALLQKVEELTLYIIEQEKRINEQHAIIERQRVQLEEETKALKSRLDKLEQHCKSADIPKAE